MTTKKRIIERLERIQANIGTFPCLFKWGDKSHLVEKINCGTNKGRVFIFLQKYDPISLCFEFSNASDLHLLIQALNGSCLITSTCVV